MDSELVTECCEFIKDLDQKDEADPHNYKPVFTLHSKECTRIDSWCYFCQAYDDLDRPIPIGEGGGCPCVLKIQISIKKVLFFQYLTINLHF